MLLTLKRKFCFFLNNLIGQSSTILVLVLRSWTTTAAGFWWAMTSPTPTSVWRPQWMASTGGSLISGPRYEITFSAETNFLRDLATAGFLVAMSTFWRKILKNRSRKKCSTKGLAFFVIRIVIKEENKMENPYNGHRLQNMNYCVYPQFRGNSREEGG